MKDCKWALYAEVEQIEDQRREAGCKFTADLDTRTQKLCKRHKWATHINNEELTIIWVG